VGWGGVGLRKRKKGLDEKPFKRCSPGLEGGREG